MINKDRDELLTDFGKTTLKDRYLLPEEDSDIVTRHGQNRELGD